MKSLKPLLNMKLFFIFLTCCSLIAIFSVKNSWGGMSSDSLSNVDVRSIRQNPGSFRSHYIPILIYSGGK